MTTDQIQHGTFITIPKDVFDPYEPKYANVDVYMGDILENAVKPKQRVRMGDALASLSRQIGLKAEDFAIFEQVRDKKPAKPVKFE